MARIRHIAISSDDPVAAAEFYKKHFGMTELYRQPKDTGASGVWLSDGYIYFAILKFGEADVPKLGPNHDSEHRGIHHIGFMVDDEEATCKGLQADHVEPVPKFDAGRKRPLAEISDAPNRKFIGPDAVHFDVRDRGWNEAIRSGMQLYELQPAAPKAAARK
jgi:lactoylglutathione lyase